MLKAGDRIFEPAQTRGSHVDARELGASFVAYYLLGANVNQIIKMLEWNRGVGSGELPLAPDAALDGPLHVRRMDDYYG